MTVFQTKLSTKIINTGRTKIFPYYSYNIANYVIY